VFVDDIHDDEVDGVDVGSYDDFHRFRTNVAERLEGGDWGSRFPVLMRHSDSDGSWDSPAVVALQRELEEISRGFAALPPETFPPGWQTEVAEMRQLKPATLLESFIDVDGENLVGRLLSLVRKAEQTGAAISLQ
jgi:hypothetical protein